MPTLFKVIVIFPGDRRENQFIKDCNSKLAGLFSAYSQNEINAQFIAEGHADRKWRERQDQWWTFLADDELENYDNELIKHTDNWYDIQTNILVLSYGFSLSESEHLHQKLPESLKKSEIWLPIFFCENSDEYVLLRNDSSLKFLISGNNHNSSNKSGYEKLDEEQKKDQLCQLVYFLSTQDRIQFDEHSYRIGVVGLSFEKELLLDEKAKRYTYEVFKEYANDQNWVDAREKSRLILEYDKNNFNESAYKKIRSNSENIENEIKDAIRKANPSPWNLFINSLIPEYYEGYIRHLPATLAQKGQNLGKVLIDILLPYFKSNRVKETKKFQEETGNLLVSNFEIAENGLNYYKTKIEKYGESIAQDESVCSATEDIMKKNFKELPPIYPIPKPIKKHYNDFVSQIAGKPYDPVADKRGDDLLFEMKKVLEYHPTLLSLLVRAIIMGVVLMSTVMVTLNFIPDALINLSYLKAHSNLTMGCALGIPIVIAFLFYWLAVVRKIKQLQCKYLAWILYTIQEHLLNDSIIPEMKDYYRECSAFCDSIVKNIQYVQNALNDPKTVDELCDPGYFFKESYFFQKIKVEDASIRWKENVNMPDSLKARFYKIKREAVTHPVDWFKACLFYPAIEENSDRHSTQEDNENKKDKRLKIEFLYDGFKNSIQCDTDLSAYDGQWYKSEMIARGFPSCQYDSVPTYSLTQKTSGKVSYVLHVQYEALHPSNASSSQNITQNQSNQ